MGLNGKPPVYSVLNTAKGHPHTRMPPLFMLSFNMNVATIYITYYMQKVKKVNTKLNNIFCHFLMASMLACDNSFLTSAIKVKLL